MALGPKAMIEAIIANLKAKSGKDLAEWQAELVARGFGEPDAARQFLREQGLGQFQANAVIEHTFAGDRYSDERQLVDDQFARFPDQRALYDHAVQSLGDDGFTPKPCRTYLPLYRDGRIAVSFKPTARGLYAAVNLAHAAAWPERIEHKASLGGTPRLKDGVYIPDNTVLEALLSEVR